MRHDGVGPENTMPPPGLQNARYSRAPHPLDIDRERKQHAAERIAPMKLPILPTLSLSAAGLLLLTVPRAAAQTPSASPSPTAAPSASATPAPPTEKEDLVAVAKAAGNFKTFLKAVDAAGLTATLQKPGPYTVFAPTDTAFTKLPAGTLDDLLKPENKARLVATISYHIATGKLSAADLAKADEVKTLEGTEIDVDTSTDGKIIEIDEAKILGSDVEASNGVIHAIDAVLQP